LTDDEILHHGRVFTFPGPERFHAESNRLLENLCRKHSGALPMMVGLPIDGRLKQPSGWASSFYHDSGELVYRNCEMYCKPAKNIFTDWIAKALDS
jgi:hypothetical protein